VGVIEGSIVESIINPEKVNPPLLGAGLDRSGLLSSGLDRRFLFHQQNQKEHTKNLRKTNREIDKFFRYQNIYDYERPQKKVGFQDEAELETGAFSLRIASGGRLVELSRKLGKKPEELGKKSGDVIDGYSRESRNRFIKLLLSIDYKAMGAPFYYTMTYPGEFSNDPRVWKRDLDVFIHRLKREFPDLCGTWRLEPQKRGAPHFSGFLWGCDRLETFEGKKWFSLQWFEVVGSGDERHLWAGTGISRELMVETRIFYLAKYQTKAEKGGVSQQFDYPVGRYWGVFERKKLSINIEDRPIDRTLYFKLRRVMKKRLEKKLGKNRFREAVKGKQNGLWMIMSNQDILGLLSLFVDEREQS
jgi:hypothetical protein